MSEGEQLVVDNFQLVNCIAQGTHSQIWEVVEQGGSQPLAMKLLLPDALKEREQVQVLKHETKVARSLEHPNFVKVHKSAFTKKHGYMTMDYFRAPNLKSLILGDPVSAQVRIRKLVESLCAALAFMHEKGWVHRDIKPDNILFNKGSELRLIDFSLTVRGAGGLSKLFGGKVKAIQGTRTYIAPETILKRAATPQTDMYSLGVTLYEVLTGQPPFKGSSPNDLLQRHLHTKAPPPSALHPNVTPEMDRLVLRLLSKKPDDRHKTMHEVFAEFRSLQVFKEDVQERADVADAARKHNEIDTLGNFGSRVNSRADALRTETGQPSAAPRPKPRPKPAPPAPAAQPPTPAQPQYAPPPGWPYGPPGAPQHGPPPGYAYPPPPQGAPYAWPQPVAGQPYPPQGAAPAYPPPEGAPAYPQPAPHYYPPQYQPAPGPYPPGAGPPPQAGAQTGPQTAGPSSPPPGVEPSAAPPSAAGAPSAPAESMQPPSDEAARRRAATSKAGGAGQVATFQFADAPATEGQPPDSAERKRPADDEDLPLMEELPDVV